MLRGKIVNDVGRTPMSRNPKKDTSVKYYCRSIQIDINVAGAES
jgi:hypothetical protein